LYRVAADPVKSRRMPWQNEKAQAAAASGPCARESERRVVCQRPLRLPSAMLAILDDPRTLSLTATICVVDVGRSADGCRSGPPRSVAQRASADGVRGAQQRHRTREFVTFVPMR
jgi:hypothetical protein